jgi:hypothetical protein
MPVEEFGKALLRGLGWADGQGVGRKRQVGQPVWSVLLVACTTIYTLKMLGAA